MRVRAGLLPALLIGMLLPAGNAFTGLQIIKSEKVNVIVLHDAGIFLNRAGRRSAQALLSELQDNYVTGELLEINIRSETAASLALKLANFYLALEESSSLLLVSLGDWDPDRGGLRLRDGVITHQDISDLLPGSRSMAVLESCADLANMRAAAIVNCSPRSKGDVATALTAEFARRIADGSPNVDAVNIERGLEAAFPGSNEVLGNYPYDFRIWKRPTPIGDTDIELLSDDELIGILYSANQAGRRLTDLQYESLTAMLLLGRKSADFQDIAIQLLADARRFDDLNRIVVESRSSYSRSLAIGVLVDSGAGTYVIDAVRSGIEQNGIAQLFALSNVPTLVAEFAASGDAVESGAPDTVDLATSLRPAIETVIESSTNPGAFTFQLAIRALAAVAGAESLVAVLGAHPDQKGVILSALAGAEYDDSEQLQDLVLDGLRSGDADLISAASKVVANEPRYITSSDETQDLGVKVLMNNLFNRDDQIAVASIHALRALELDPYQRKFLTEIIGLNMYRPEARMTFVEYIAESGVVTDANVLLPLLEIKDTRLRRSVLDAFDQLRARFPGEMRTISETDREFIEGFAEFYVDSLIRNAPPDGSDPDLYAVAKDRLGQFPQAAFDDVVYDRLRMAVIEAGSDTLDYDFIDILGDISTVRSVEGLVSILESDIDDAQKSYTLETLAIIDDIDLTDALYDYAMAVLNEIRYPPFEELGISAMIRLNVLAGKCDVLEELHNRKVHGIAAVVDRIDLAKCHFGHGDTELAFEELNEIERNLRNLFRAEEDVYVSGMMRIRRMRAWMYIAMDQPDLALIEMTGYLAIESRFPDNDLSIQERKSAMGYLAQAVGDDPGVRQAVEAQIDILERRAEFDAIASR